VIVEPGFVRWTPAPAAAFEKPFGRGMLDGARPERMPDRVEEEK